MKIVTHLLLLVTAAYAQKENTSVRNSKLVSDVLSKIDPHSESGPKSFHSFNVRSIAREKKNTQTISEHKSTIQIPDKHVPFLTVVDKTHLELKVRGTGGSETNLHPQTPDHYISKVWAVDEFSGEIIFFADISESKEASVVFEIPEGTETLLSYSYCNLHGLYEGDTFTLERVEL